MGTNDGKLPHLDASPPRRLALSDRDRRAERRPGPVDPEPGRRHPRSRRAHLSAAVTTTPRHVGTSSPAIGALLLGADRAVGESVDGPTGDRVRCRDGPRLRDAKRPDRLPGDVEAMRSALAEEPGPRSLRRRPTYGRISRAVGLPLIWPIYAATCRAERRRRPESIADRASICSRWPLVAAQEGSTGAATAMGYRSTTNGRDCEG